MRKALLLVVFLVFGFAPTAAHADVPGDLKLEVAGDGATGVTVRAMRADGRPIETDVRLVLTATAAGGRAVGPLQLNPAGEGRGFYSSGPVLTPGTWTVVVTAPSPSTVRAESVVEARAAQTPPPPPTATAAAPSPRPGSSNLWVWGLVAAAAAAAFAVTAVVRLRRSP